MTVIEDMRKIAWDLEHGYELKGASHLLRELADQIERETLPRPLFEDGEPVQFGDEFVNDKGDVLQVNRITLLDDGRFILNGWFKRERFKRPEPPDTWERLTAEVEACDGSACQYFKKDHDPKNHSCEGCKAAESGKDCLVLAMDDVLRRAKRLAGIEEE